jgi:hypothetical protein
MQERIYLPDHHSALTAMISLWLFKHIEDIYKLIQLLKNKKSHAQEIVEVHDTKFLLCEIIIHKLDNIFLGFNKSFISCYEIDLFKIVVSVTTRFSQTKIKSHRVQLSISSLGVIYR